MRKKNLNDLFASDTSVKERGPLFVTNQNNFFRILSSGLIGPRAAYGEGDEGYYSDFLEVSPGLVPLFRAPVSEGIVNRVLSYEEALPVFLELDPAALPRSPVRAFREDGPYSAPFSDPEAWLWAQSNTLPLTWVRSIHFLSEGDKSEVVARLRILGNVPVPHHEFLAVTPDLVGTSAYDVEVVTEELRSLQLPGTADPEAFEETDRVGGGVSLALSLCPEWEDYLVAKINGEDEEAPVGIPAWMRLPLYPTDVDVPADPDSRTFATAVRVLHRQPHGVWRPREVLHSIRDELDRGGLSVEDTGDLDRAFIKIERILTNERDFEPSRSNALPSLQGLMLFLIRHNPDDVLTWKPEEISTNPSSADLAVRVAAALYAGLASGRERLPATMRDPGVDARLALASARRLSSSESPGVGDTEVSSPPREGDGPQTLLLEGDLESMGLKRRAAIDVCGFMEWRDCVTSTVIFPDVDPEAPSELSTTQRGTYNKKKLITYRIPGVAELHHELHVDRFKERLGEERLPDRVISHVRKVLRDDR